jgi:hypothetical protein
MPSTRHKDLGALISKKKNLGALSIVRKRDVPFESSMIKKQFSTVQE